MKKISVRSLCRCAMVAALYFAVSVAMLPLAFGAVQVRVAEALTLLPVLSPIGVWGVTLGCLLTNAYGVAAGANILGPLDVLFGTAATFFAALLSRRLRDVRVWGIPFASALPPVVLNALVVGMELTFAETGGLSPSLLLLFNVLSVGAGQTAACALGIMLFCAIERSGLARPAGWER